MAYPNYSTRASNLVKAASEFHTSVPVDYEKLFEDLPQPTHAGRQTLLLLSLADVASESVVPKLIHHVNDIVSKATIEEGGQATVMDIYDGFRSHIVPARDPVALADILNAGWKAFHDPKLWEGQVKEENRDRTLKELLLKSIEVLEFRTRTKASP